MAGVSRLDLPARKLFVADLQQAVEVATPESLCQLGIKSWSSRSINGDSGFSIVWLQGRVLEVTPEYFTMNDSTGTAQIIRANVPSACPAPVSGRYMMVIGQLDLANCDVPVVRAIKVQDLSTDTVLQELWPIEVNDMRINVRCQ